MVLKNMTNIATSEHAPPPLLPNLLPGPSAPRIARRRLRNYFVCIIYVVFLCAHVCVCFCVFCRVLSCCSRYNEPTGVKNAKVRCLALLADPNTAEAVIGELGEYAADIDPLLARQAIRAVGKICLRLPGSAAAAIERLIDLMGMDVRTEGEEDRGGGIRAYQ